MSVSSTWVMYTNAPSMYDIIVSIRINNPTVLNKIVNPRFGWFHFIQAKKLAEFLRPSGRGSAAELSWEHCKLICLPLGCLRSPDTIKRTSDAEIRGAQVRSILASYNSHCTSQYALQPGHVIMVENRVMIPAIWSSSSEELSHEAATWNSRS